MTLPIATPVQRKEQPVWMKSLGVP